MATADSDFKIGESWIHLAPIFPISPEIQPDLAKSFQQSLGFLAYPQFSPAPPHTPSPNHYRFVEIPNISRDFPPDPVGSLQSSHSGHPSRKLRFMVSFVSEQRDPTAGDDCKRPKQEIATATDFEVCDSRILLARTAGCKSGNPQRETPTGDHSGSPQRDTTVGD